MHLDDFNVSNIKMANGELSCLALYRDQELTFTCILTLKIKGKKIEKSLSVTQTEKKKKQLRLRLLLFLGCLRQKSVG